eukprot:g20652.t1
MRSGWQPSSRLGRRRKTREDEAYQQHARTRPPEREKVAGGGESQRTDCESSARQARRHAVAKAPLPLLWARLDYTHANGQQTAAQRQPNAPETADAQYAGPRRKSWARFTRRMRKKKVYQIPSAPRPRRRRRALLPKAEDGFYDGWPGPPKKHRVRAKGLVVHGEESDEEKDDESDASMGVSPRAGQKADIPDMHEEIKTIEEEESVPAVSMTLKLTKEEGGEEERKRKEAEEEKKRKEQRSREEEYEKREEKERKRIAEEEAAERKRKQKAQEEAMRAAIDARIRAEEEQEAKKQAELEAKRKAEEDAKRRAEEEAAAKEAERLRKEKRERGEGTRGEEAEEKARKEEEEKRRKAQEVEDRKKREAEEAKKKEEEGNQEERGRGQESGQSTKRQGRKSLKRRTTCQSSKLPRGDPSFAAEMKTVNELEEARKKVQAANGSTEAKTKEDEEKEKQRAAEEAEAKRKREEEQHKQSAKLLDELESARKAKVEQEEKERLKLQEIMDAKEKERAEKLLAQTEELKNELRDAVLEDTEGDIDTERLEKAVIAWRVIGKDIKEFRMAKDLLRILRNIESAITRRAVQDLQMAIREAERLDSGSPQIAVAKEELDKLNKQAAAVKKLEVAIAAVPPNQQTIVALVAQCEKLERKQTRHSTNSTGALHVHQLLFRDSADTLQVPITSSTLLNWFVRFEGQYAYVLQPSNFIPKVIISMIILSFAEETLKLSSWRTV